MNSLETHLENKTHVIWDWNGTLINDVDFCLGIMQDTLKAHGMPHLDREAHRSLFQMPIRNYYAALGFDFERVSFESLNDDFVNRYLEGVHECELFPGTENLLERLAAQKKTMGILSAAHQEQLEILLQRYGIHHFFDAIYGLPDTLAQCKKDRGRQLLEQWNAPVETTILIGDMDHDYEVAQELGIDVLLLGDGHQSYERLIEIHPNTLRKRQ